MEPDNDIFYLFLLWYIFPLYPFDIKGSRLSRRAIICISSGQLTLYRYLWPVNIFFTDFIPAFFIFLYNFKFRFLFYFSIIVIYCYY